MAKMLKRIMVVEDEPVVALDLESTLERLGYAVVAQTDTGEDAVLLAGNVRPDLVLMDITLAGDMDGIEAADRVWREQRIPVIYLSAYSTRELVERATDAGSFGFLVKPFQSGSLRTSIEVALHKSRMEQDLRQSRDQLERCARQRTTELVAVNESLRREIGHRRRVEAELRQAKEAAENSARAKTEFLATVCHELRTPLHAIIRYNEILPAAAAERSLDRGTQYLDRVHEAARHLQSMLDDVLDLLRIEGGHLQLQMESVVVADLVASLRIQAQALMRLNGNAFRCTVAANAGVADADPQRLRQCLMNLLTNAARCTRGGEVHLDVERVRGDEGTWLEFRVGATGTGILRENQSGPFAVFTQVNGSSTCGCGEPGLAVALSTRLCRMMGGQIQVDSIPGGGSTFTVRIPA